MKLKQLSLIKDLPPKLQKLALKRAQQSQCINPLEKTLDAAFVWSDTPEGIGFWASVHTGAEFDWQEEKTEEEEKFKRGQLVYSTVDKFEGIYVGMSTEIDENIAIIQRTDGGGWKYSPREFPKDYIPPQGALFWNVEIERLELPKKKEQITEEKKKNSKFDVGDRVEAISTGWQGMSGRIMEKGEKGIVEKIIGNKVHVKAEKDEMIISRLDTCLQKIPQRKEHRPIGKGFYEQLGEAHTFFYPSYFLRGIDPYDAFGSSRSIIEKLPNIVLIKKKKTKRRLI